MKKPVVTFLLLIILFGIFFIYQKKTSRALKIGFVTDWEYGKNNQGKSKESTKLLLLKAVSHYNYFFKPDLVIGGGDYIEKNQENLGEINAIFKKIKAEKNYCLGKKDYTQDSLEEIKSSLNLESTYYSKLHKKTRVIILDTTQNDKPETTIGTINKSQLTWLKEELKNSEPALIFLHHSPIETPSEDTWQKNLTNQDEVYQLLKENSNKIIAVFSGNGKQDYITKKSGIPFINIGGLSDYKTLGRFSGIKITPDKENESLIVINLENQGKNQSTYKIKRDLTSNTSTRITLVNRKMDRESQKWFDLETPKHPQGVLSSEAGGEPNINVTDSGTIIVAFENKKLEGKIQIKAYKNNQWQDLEDSNHPQGLISLGKGSNPNIVTRGEDVFATFTETDHDERVRLLQWNNKNQEWLELSDQGFLSDKYGHEPALIFDKNQENLYVAFAEKIREGRNQTQAKIIKWNEKKWETITNSLLAFAHQRNSSVDEFDLVASTQDNSIYITYQEIESGGESFVRVKKWDGVKWNNLKIDKLYYEKISQINGYSPSIAIDSEENLYLAFVENNNGMIHVYRHGEFWEELKTKPLDQKAIEPFIEIGKDNTPFLAYSEYKSNIVMAKKNDKKTGEELIKTNAWRVRAQKYENDKWIDLEDEFNFNGFISKGSGKGDPALKSFENDLYLIFSDEENDYAPRVKKYLLN